MNLRRTITFAVLSSLVACGADKVVVIDRPAPIIVSVTLSLPDSLVLVGQPVTPTVVVKDAGGGPAAGAKLTWTSSDTLVASVSETGTITPHAIGFATIAATAKDVHGTLPISVALGRPAQLLAPGSDALQSTAGDAVAGLPTLFVLDQQGQPVPGVAVSVRPDSSAGTVVLGADHTDLKGAIQIVRWAPSTRAAKQHALVTARALTLDLFVTVRPGPAASMVFVSGGDQEAQAGFTLLDPVTVRVVDRFGNGVSGVTVGFQGDGVAYGTLSTTSMVSDAAGLVSTRWTLPNTPPGYVTLTIHSNSLPSLTATALILAFTAKTVSVGIDHACAIDLTNRMWCWGYNGFGELGYSPTSLYSSSRPVLVPTALRFVSVAASEWATCAIATDGRTYCWGNNATGQLADPIVSQSRGLAPIAGMTFTDISMQHAEPNCGVTSAGDVYCWQYHSAVPTQVGGLPEPITQVTGRTCALGASKQVYCFGDNYCVPSAVNGYCHPTTTNATPLLKPTPEPIARLSHGMISAPGPCAISMTSKLYCTRTVLTPENSATYPLDSLITLDGPVIDVSNGFNESTCAVTTTGSLYCWGPENSYGTLGTGDMQPHLTPREITGGRFSAKQISAGYLSMCAIDKHSQVWCWGAQVQGLTYNGGGPPILAPTLILP